MLWKMYSLQQYFSVRLLDWQYMCLNWQFSRSIQQKNISRKNKARLLKNLYQIMNLAIVNKNEIIAYKTVDLLKLAFGEKFIRPGESGWMMNVCVHSLKAKQYAITCYILEAYKPLLRNADIDDIAEILNRLILIENIAKRLNQLYILNKVANCIFEGIGKLNPKDEVAVIAAVDALRTVGLNAIKNGDVPLFKESGTCLLSIRLINSPLVSARVSLLLSIWLHQIIKRDHQDLLTLFGQSCFTLVEQDDFDQSILKNFLVECNNFVGEIAANHRLCCNKEFVKLLLDLSGQSVDLMKITVRIINKIVRLAVKLQGINQTFILLRPLLEKGRSLLNHELKFTQSSSSLRKMQLFVIIKEFVLLLDFIAKQDTTSTNIEIMMKFKFCWSACYQKAINRQSVNQFCQLALQYLMKIHLRRDNRLCAKSKFLLDNSFFSEGEIKRLNLG